MKISKLDTLSAEPYNKLPCCNIDSKVNNWIKKFKSFSYITGFTLLHFKLVSGASRLWKEK